MVIGALRWIPLTFHPILKGKTLKIERMNKGSWGKIRAFLDVRTEDGFVIKGFKLVEGVNGLFVGFPSQKGNDGEYHDTVWADKEVKDALTQLAMKEYGGDIMNGGYTADPYSDAPPPVVPGEGPAALSDDDIPF
ncbi:MAG: septation protein SpoVG family protein [Saprospiraceae bacterium]